MKDRNNNMTDESPKTQDYELAYHLDPTIEESTIENLIGGLEVLVSESGGSVISRKETAKTRLSYPIKQRREAFFGFFNFSAGPEIIDAINNRIKLQSGILRYLLMKAPNLKEGIKTLSDPRARAKTKEGSRSQTVTKPEAPKIDINPQQLEKELDTVLDKI